MSSTPPRSEKLDLRLTPLAKQQIYRAATAAQRTVSDFVLDSALKQADEILADRQRFSLTAEQWADFMTALDAPPRHHPRLARLLSEPSIFETDTAT